MNTGAPCAPVGPTLPKVFFIGEDDRRTIETDHRGNCSRHLRLLGNSRSSLLPVGIRKRLMNQSSAQPSSMRASWRRPRGRPNTLKDEPSMPGTELLGAALI